MRKKYIANQTDLEKVINEWGFLPFFQNEISGFSVEELIDPRLWFSDENPGPWEWKGPVASSRKFAYGKFFHNKAGFISLEWLPDLISCRRNGCLNFYTLYESGNASLQSRRIIEALTEKGPLLTSDLKYYAGFRRGGLTGFDTAVTQLQMQTFICAANFEYKRDRFGKPYGWGIARWALFENWFGEELIHTAASRRPLESLTRIHQHISEIFPNASENQISRLMD